jgi:hypothetical protein
MPAARSACPLSGWLWGFLDTIKAGLRAACLRRSSSVGRTMIGRLSAMRQLPERSWSWHHGGGVPSSGFGSSPWAA